MTLSALFAGIEIALISANSIVLKGLAEKGSHNAKKALTIIDRREEVVSMLLIGNNIVSVASATFITYVVTKSFILDDQGLMILTAIQTIIFLIVCELTPKVIARTKSEFILSRLSYFILFFLFILKPLVIFSLFFTNRLKKRFKLQKNNYAIIGSRDEVSTLFNIGKHEGILENDHHLFIDEILGLHKTTALEVMIPIVDVVAVDIDENIKVLSKTIEKFRFSRIPVYSERIDNIIGYVYYKDLLFKKVGAIKEILRKPYFVPETKNIYDLFSEMQAKEIPMVFVVNEFGGVEGIITMEDIAEEIVGEIQTQDHPVEMLIEQYTVNTFLLAGSVDLGYIERKFPLTFEKKGFETLAGFVNHKLGKIAQKNDTLSYQGYTFTVKEATPRSIEKILLTIPGKK